MINSNKIAVVGGDMRCAICADMLGEAGYEVAVCGLEKYQKKLYFTTKCLYAEDAVREADAIILPIPFSKDGRTVNAPLSSREIGLTEVLRYAKSGAHILGGCITNLFYSSCSENGVRCTDYGNDSGYKTLNALPTAEAALAIAVESTDITLHSAKCLVISYGKVGASLSALLKAIGADVTVAVRNTKYHADIFSLGYGFIMSDELESVCGDFDIIFNAAPQLILGKNILDKVKKDALIIDLSSMPGGVDFKYSNDIGIRSIHALSLPGKYAPLTAGKYLAKTVINILKGEQVI